MKIKTLAFSTAVSFLAHAASAQTTASTGELQSKIADRVDRLASYLDEQAKAGAALQNRLSTAKPEQLNDILSKAGLSNSAIANMAKSGSADLQSIPRLPTVARATLKQATVDNVSTTSRSAATYASYLHNLSSEIRNSSPAQATAIVNAGYVPPSVGNLLDPARVSGFPVAPSTSLGQYIVRGSFSIDFPAVAAILYNQPQGGLGVGCTGTLVAPNAILTAAHCLKGQSPQKVFFQHAGLFEISQVVWNNDHYVPDDGQHPDFPASIADVGLIFLKSSIPDITPLSLNDRSLVSIGTAGLIIGYGWHTLPQVVAAAGPPMPILVPKPGIKVYASTTTNQCVDNQAGKNLLCWTYPTGTLVETIGSTCFGDSGGPLVVQASDGTSKLAGVTSGGKDTDGACHPGDRAYDTEVFPYVQWIKSELSQTPPGPASGGVRPLQPLFNDQDADYMVQISDRQFAASATSWPYAFKVRIGGKILRISVNATVSGDALKLQATPPSGQAPCAMTTDDTALLCDMTAAQGDWTLTITGAVGQEYQVVATEFYAP